MNELDMLKALDNEIRFQIMKWLKNPQDNFGPQGIHLPEGVTFERGVCVGAICRKAGISQSTISHYMDILQRAGLVESLRAGKWTYYRSVEENVKHLAQYLQDQI